MTHVVASASKMPVRCAMLLLMACCVSAQTTTPPQLDVAPLGSAEVELWVPDAHGVQAVYTVPSGVLAGLRSTVNCVWRRTDQTPFSAFVMLDDNQKLWSFQVYTGTKKRDIVIERYVAGAMAPQTFVLRVGEGPAPEPEPEPDPDVDLTGFGKEVYDAAQVVPSIRRRGDAAFLYGAFNKALSAGVETEAELYNVLNEALNKQGVTIDKNWKTTRDRIRQEMTKNKGNLQALLRVIGEVVKAMEALQKQEV